MLAFVHWGPSGKGESSVWETCGLLLELGVHVGTMRPHGYPTRGSPAMPTLEMWLELGYAPVRVQSSRSFGLTLWHREPTRLSLGIGMLLLSVFLAVGNGRLAAGFWLRPLWSPGYTTQGIIETSQCGCLLRSAGRSFPGMSLPRQAV